MIQKDIKRVPLKSGDKIKDSLKEEKFTKKSILKENQEFLENLKFDKNNYLFIISSDSVYIELTANLNPIYKNLMNLALDSYKEKDFINTIKIFEDISKLIKTTNDNYDCVFNQKINEWIKLLRNNNVGDKNEIGDRKINRDKSFDS